MTDGMTDGITPSQEGFLASLKLREVTEGLSTRDIENMSMSDYAAIRRRAGLADVDPFEHAYKDYEPPGAPFQEAPTAPQPVQEQPQGLDPSSQEYFLAWRQERLARSTSGQGRGIFDQADRDQIAEGARAQAGRTGLSNQNVQEPPRMARVYTQDSPVQGRTMGYRGQ
jgi:hypothetical protein